MGHARHLDKAFQLLAISGVVMLAAACATEKTDQASSIADGLSSSSPVLGRAGGAFTLDGSPTFLLGVTYFDALDWHESDLDAFKARGFNLIRILLDKEWDGVGSETVFDSNGALIASRRDRVMNLIQAAGARGIVVDVSVLYADTDGSNSAVWLTTPEARAAAIRNAVRFYGAQPNVLFDIVNEHNGGSFADSDGDEMSGYMAAAREGSATALLGYSSAEAFGGHLLDGADNVVGIGAELANGVQILMPHNLRGSDWAARSGTRARNLRAALDGRGRSDVPVYFQEENRRGGGYGDSSAAEFVQAAVGCKENGCAAWIFHTAASFQMSGASFTDQLDDVERNVFDTIASAVNGGGANVTEPDTSAPHDTMTDAEGHSWSLLGFAPSYDLHRDGGQFYMNGVKNHGSALALVDGIVYIKGTGGDPNWYYCTGACRAWSTVPALP